MWMHTSARGVCCLGGQSFYQSRVMMSCATPIETPFYMSSHIKCQKDISRHCGALDVMVDAALLAKHSRVIPACERCRAMRKDVLKTGKQRKYEHMTNSIY